MPFHCRRSAKRSRVEGQAGVDDGVLCVCATCGGQTDVGGPACPPARVERWVAAVVEAGMSVVPEQSYLLLYDEVWDEGFQQKTTTVREHGAWQSSTAYPCVY